MPERHEHLEGEGVKERCLEDNSLFVFSSLKEIILLGSPFIFWKALIIKCQSPPNLSTPQTH